jgi:hypothetical protein
MQTTIDALQTNLQTIRKAMLQFLEFDFLRVSVTLKSQTLNLPQSHDFTELDRDVLQIKKNLEHCNLQEVTELMKKADSLIISANKFVFEHLPINDDELPSYAESTFLTKRCSQYTSVLNDLQKSEAELKQMCEQQLEQPYKDIVQMILEAKPDDPSAILNYMQSNPQSKEITLQVLEIMSPNNLRKSVQTALHSQGSGSNSAQSLPKIEDIQSLVLIIKENLDLRNDSVLKQFSKEISDKILVASKYASEKRNEKPEKSAHIFKKECKMFLNIFETAGKSDLDIAMKIIAESNAASASSAAASKARLKFYFIALHLK